ncbi:MAG: ATP-dependent helicase UvrD/PcrA [Acidimicrobiaceae bacterium]|nr:ATP-dependent helicase UvrD/PcrA [Acidimicrobiaceae bacterium]
MFDQLALSAEQWAAVTHDDGNLLIVAGAGTGKTSTLAARLADLVRRGVAPERILLLTFSRRAASELVTRAEAMAGQAVAAAVWSGTFHAVGNRLLRRFGVVLGLEPSFTMLDAADAADLMALVRDEVSASDGTNRRRARKETLVDILSRCVNAERPLAEVLRTSFPWCADDRDVLRATFTAYVGRKRSRQLLDYDDLLLCWRGLLADAGTAAVLHSMFDHVLVDEYQDTNTVQADIVAGMTSGGACVTVVGDDAQAIYSFRAANHDNIMGFAERFSAATLTLTRNHRSTGPILATTNALIAEARRRHDKDLVAVRPGGVRPVLVRCHDEAMQAVAVSERILRHREQDIPLRRQAVLVRSGHHSDLLELELTARRIPFVKYGGLKFLEAAHVKDLVSALRLVENDRDELAWVRTLQHLDGVGRATARSLTDAIVTADEPLVAAGTDRRLGELLATLHDVRTLPEGAVAEQVERVRMWLEPLLEARYDAWPARQADLEQLQLAAATAPDLSRFLVELTLDPPAVTGDLAGPPHLDEDVLTVSTIHSAKGGEWDVVHVLHLADGNIPSDMALGDADGLEEERRLLYVALTRARDHLYAYAPLRYHHQVRGKRDKHGYAPLSRFLSAAVRATMEEQLAVARPGARTPSVSLPADGRRMEAIDAAVAALLD